MAIGGQSLALREIVQRAELVLQLLQRGESNFAPLGVLFAGKDARKELDRVAQILRLNAQFVTPFDIECPQICTLLADPLSPAREQFSGMFANRLLTPLAQVRVARPRSRLDPLG